jgi:hypothetical protein
LRDVAVGFAGGGLPLSSIKKCGRCELLLACRQRGVSLAAHAGLALARNWVSFNLEAIKQQIDKAIASDAAK